MSGLREWGEGGRGGVLKSESVTEHCPRRERAGIEDTNSVFTTAELAHQNGCNKLEPER